MQIPLHLAIKYARRVAPLSHSAAARVLIAAGVPFITACRYAIHCARSARSN